MLVPQRTNLATFGTERWALTVSLSCHTMQIGPEHIIVPAILQMAWTIHLHVMHPIKALCHSAKLCMRRGDLRGG